MAVTVGAAGGRMTVMDGSAPVEPQLSILNRTSGVAEASIVKLIRDALSVIQDECRVRVVAYLYDGPSFGRGDFQANAWRNSEAGTSALSRTVRRAVIEVLVAAEKNWNGPLR